LKIEGRGCDRIAVERGAVGIELEAAFVAAVMMPVAAAEIERRYAAGNSFVALPSRVGIVRGGAAELSVARFGAAENLDAAVHEAVGRESVGLALVRPPTGQIVVHVLRRHHARSTVAAR